METLLQRGEYKPYDLEEAVELVENNIWYVC